MSLRIISGKLGGRWLKTLEGKGFRPTTERVRGAMFSILGEAVIEAKTLDLFAGSGALGIEALSRGAGWSDFVEMDRRRAARIRQNLVDLDLDHSGYVYQGRVGKVLKKLPGPYDLVLIGAPYDLETWDELLEEIDEAELVGKDGRLVAEYRHGTELKERQGPLVRNITRRYGDTGLSVYIREESSG